jgi:hypothetical protein
MTAWTDRRDRGRRLAALAGGAALIVTALGATACAGTPTGSTSLSGQQAAAGLPSPDPLMTPVTVSMPPATTSAPRHGGASSAAGTPGATSPGAGAPSHGSPTGQASDPAAQAVPSAPAAGPAPSQPQSAGPPSGTGGNSPGGSSSGSPGGSSSGSSGGSSGGSSDGTVSASSSCTQITVEVLASFSCSVTASGGTPGYGWTLFINGQLIAANGTMPPGFETTVSYANGQDVTETLEGKPELTGTYNVTLTAQDMTPVNPPHTASASFTIVVTPNPNVKTYQP